MVSITSVTSDTYGQNTANTLNDNFFKLQTVINNILENQSIGGILLATTYDESATTGILICSEYNQGD